MSRRRRRSASATASAIVTLTNREDGARRTAATDPGGRFLFAELKPGAYSLRVEARGFVSQQNDTTSAGLGKTQRVDFTLRLASAKQTVRVTGAAPLLDTHNLNTATTFNAKALENLPNPGGDMTYPLQFASGALINTAGSGNDFVGSTNGYGNVEFNGLPALSNGYIVDARAVMAPLRSTTSPSRAPTSSTATCMNSGTAQP